MLPDSKGDLSQPGRYADTAIPEMMRLLRDTMGGLNLRLAAKMVGGAKMFAFQSGVTVGDQNVAAVERILQGLGIPVLARDCGGERGRRVSFDITNGEMRVETLGLPPAIL
jgi:chemotaxis protein CheD